MMKKRKKVIIFGTTVGIGIIMVYQALRIQKLENSLSFVLGEKKNQEFLIKGLEKELKNLLYQMGKLSTKR